MTVTRAIAATTMFAGLTVGAASSAWADAPTMTGHYIRIVTSPAGQASNVDWYFAPCGDGCASVALTAGGQPFGQARLVNGQWALDTTSPAGCADGTSVPDALNSHYTWDPNTLAGTAQTTIEVPSCGRPVGYQQTNSVQLRQAP
jgi:hypothetical protein